MTEIELLHRILDDLEPDELLEVAEFLERFNKRRLPSGEIIAENVTLEDYMEHYAEQHTEWVEGYVIKMSPAEVQHNEILYYLYQFLRAYFELKPLGRVFGQPFVQFLPAFPNHRREPDLLVLLNSNPAKLHKTYLEGAADICIEVISEESKGRDHVEKFKEYQEGGVTEYWIIDHFSKVGLFYRLNDEGKYIGQKVDENDHYITSLLPGLKLHLPTLWRDPLPGTIAIATAVQSMLNE